MGLGSRGGAGSRPGSEGYAERFVGANGEYNPFGRHFPAPPAPPRKPGFWPWLDAKKSIQELAKGSPNPQYYLTNWIDRVNHMNFLGWVDGPTDVRPGISLDLIEKGIHPLRIATGFEKACEVAVKRVEEISKLVDILADEQAALKKAATTALGSKVVSSRKDQLAKISVDAVLAVDDFLLKVPKGKVRVVVQGDANAGLGWTEVDGMVTAVGVDITPVFDAEQQVLAFTIDELRKGQKAVGRDLTSKELLQGVVTIDGGQGHLLEFMNRSLAFQRMPKAWKQQFSQKWISLVALVTYDQ
eukprot:s1001_g16.t1